MRFRSIRARVAVLTALFAFLLVDHWLLPLMEPAAAFELRPVG